LEYYSDTWCESSAGTDQRIWTADTDVPLLPDDCFILGLIWRFRKAKGLEYQEDFNTYEEEVSRRLARTNMAPVIQIGGGVQGVRLIDESNIPETGYGV
jgi:hypothetical protein